MRNKIYIASGLKNHLRTIQLRDKLTALGLEITFDWAERYKLDLEQGKKQESNDAYLAQIAEDEYQGVKACDVLLLLCPAGRGAHVEFGVAYALGKPIVILDETDGKDKIAFHSLFGVQRHTTEEGAIKDVQRLLNY